MNGPLVYTPEGAFRLARSCDGCTLCCRVLEAVTLNKPMGVLCQHCVVGQGCSIHEDRVAECKHYHCGWLIDGKLGEEWRPEHAHIIITYDLDGRRLNVHADPLHPDAWRNEPYYSQLRQWAAEALPRGGQVAGYLGKAVTLFLPDRHVDLGVLGADEYIFIEDLGDGGWDARKVNDAEVQALRQAGKLD